MVSLKRDEQFSINYFLNVIEAEAWDQFFDEFIVRDGDAYSSNHPDRMMRSYPVFMFEDVQPRTVEASEDF